MLVECELIMRRTLKPTGGTMSDQTPEQEVNTATKDDSKADVVAIVVIFTATVLMAAHLISGFTIDV